MASLGQGPRYQLGSTTSFLTFAVMKELKIYVNEKLNQDPSLLHKKKGRPLLDYALDPLLPPRRLKLHPRLEMVQELLGRGADPNQAWAGSTVWRRFLYLLITAYQDPTFPRDLYYQCIKLLLLHNADSHMKVDWRVMVRLSKVVKQDFDETVSAFGLIQHCFSKQEVAELTDLMASRESLRITRRSWFQFW